MSTLAPTAAPGGLVRDLVSLTKPRITLEVVVTAAGALWLAPGRRPLGASVAVLLATAAVVMAANALNCWMERDSDRFMTRTKTRPLPAGRLAPQSALVLGSVLGALSVPVLALAANPLTGLLGAIALVSYVGAYTPMKRKSSAALLVGAVPGALPPLMGWTAATGRIDATGLVLFGILFFWQLPHFIAIALFRREEYEAAGLVVLPSVVGDRVARALVPLTAMLLVPVTLALVPLGATGLGYGICAAVLGLGFVATALPGFRARVDAGWAKRVFRVSLVYLTLLFVALVVFAR